MNLSVRAQKLLGIAIAITGDPTLVILDEPTLGLDSATRQNIWNVIEVLKVSPTSTGQPQSILIATSSPEEAYGSPSQLRLRFGDTFQLSLLYSVEAPLPIPDQQTLAQDAEITTAMKSAEHLRTDVVLQKLREAVSPTSSVEQTTLTDFHGVLNKFRKDQGAGVPSPGKVTWTVRTSFALAKEADFAAIFVNLERVSQSLSVQSWDLQPRRFKDTV
ncbi:hypothetical protein BJ742DRAFT_359998 [Cladochytrium replicatum]|nr:hypothetical protein BJ742DRAFT_359998 [Cladochytrium replicatum]